MPIVADRNYGQILTASVAKRSRKISDIIYKATPMTAILLDQGRISKRSAGGPELRIPVEYDRLKAQWFQGYDKLEITPKEIINSAVFGWSRIVSMFSLSGDELLYNRGEEEVIDLMSTYLRAAEKSLKEDFEAGLFGTGTGSGGREILGLGAAIPTVPNTGTYGGINRANVANWRPNYFDIPAGNVPGVTTWDSTTALDVVEYVSATRSRGGQYADLWVCDINSYQAIRQAVLSLERLVSNRSERMARLGYQGFTIITAAGPVDIVCAAGVGNVMPTNTIFAIDTSALALYTFPGQEFVPFHSGDGMRPINQDAIAQGIVWSGQLVLDNPLFSSRIKTA